MKESLELTVGGGVKPDDHLSFNEEGYGERHFVREGNKYEEVTNPSLEPVLVHLLRNYNVNDSRAFIKCVSKYGVADKGIIFYTDKALTMFFDAPSRSESVVLKLSPSLELTTFLGDDGEKSFYQKDFVTALETFPECLSDIESLIPSFEKLKMDTQIDFESNVDDRDLVFIYKEKTGSQTGRIPKEIELTLPFFEGSEKSINVKVTLEVKLPKSQEEKVLFTIKDPRYKRTKRDALEAETTAISGSLKDWTFIHGDY